MIIQFPIGQKLKKNSKKKYYIHCYILFKIQLFIAKIENRRELRYYILCSFLYTAAYS